MENIENGFRRIYARIPTKLYFELRDRGILNYQFDALIYDLLCEYLERLDNGKKFKRD